jgi:hypothetical protein
MVRTGCTPTTIITLSSHPPERDGLGGAATKAMQAPAHLLQLKPPSTTEIFATVDERSQQETTIAAPGIVVLVLARLALLAGPVLFGMVPR